jgi:hypothetical protein
MNAQNKDFVPATLRSLPEIIDEYQEKLENVPTLVKDYEAFHNQVNTRCTISGEYVGRPYSYHPSLSESTVRDTLLKSAWRHVYKGLNVPRIASAKDRKAFDLKLENPPAFTLPNIRDLFGDYLLKPRFHILKGLAEVFSGLDPAFRSHSKMRIGVSGMPKRIILSSVMGEYMPGHGADRLKDTLNAIRVYEGKPHIEYVEFRDFLDDAKKKGQADFDGMTLKVFKNGNGHLIFGPEKLKLVNQALAEFYGEVLPDDCPEERETQKRQTGTAVSKDLQFYPTPRRVIDDILVGYVTPTDAAILEPSCGDGAIMDAIAERWPGNKVTGVEFHGGRVEQTRAKGHKVLQANFLETSPSPTWDYVIMNPPFYGTHWKKHVEHALKFLKPRKEDGPWRERQGGTLICILPASAFYDGHLSDMGLVRKDAHLDQYPRDSGWKDLPVGSFAESGTNVPTGYLVCGPTRY